MASKRGLHLVASICAALVLAACGGGGSSGTSSGSSGSGGTSLSNGNLATSVPAPTYAAGSPELLMFNQLNDVRLKGGFGMLAQNTALDQSTKNHANYMFQNYYSGGLWNTTLLGTVDASTGWLTAHTEKAGGNGFTGVLPVDRAIHAGYNAAYVGEVIAEIYTSSLSGSYSGCVDQLLTTVFHRSGILNPQLRTIGASVSYSSDNKTLVCIIDPAFTSSDTGSVPPGWVKVYPYDGQVALATSMIYGEAPDPVPSAPIKGQPVSIYVEPQNTLNVTSFTLTDSTGGKVPAQLLTKSSFPQYITSAMAYIVPTEALKAATTYTVQFVGTNNGAPLSRTWSFTTQ